MKGTVVAVAAGLTALVAISAVGGTLLVEHTLTQEASRVLAAEGVDATVTFSGLSATVASSNQEQLRKAVNLVLDVPGVVRVEADAASLPAASPSQSTPAPTPTTADTPEATASPTPTTGEMPNPVVHFEGGEADVPSGQRSKIVELALWLQANPDVTIEVDGHTDNGRSPAFRKELSEKRAQRVVDALVAAGANRDQLVPVGKADTEPAQSNATEEGQEANRRVTFVRRGER